MYLKLTCRLSYNNWTKNLFLCVLVFSLSRCFVLWKVLRLSLWSPVMYSKYAFISLRVSSVLWAGLIWCWDLSMLFSSRFLLATVCWCVVEKCVNGSSSCLWHNSWNPGLLREFSTNTTYPPYFLKERIMLCLRNGNIWCSIGSGHVSRQKVMKEPGWGGRVIGVLWQLCGNWRSCGCEPPGKPPPQQIMKV